MTSDPSASVSSIRFGNRRLVGQSRAREQIVQAVDSGRLSHAWLLSGPEGSGKTAFALAFAELLNGIENLSELGDARNSRKSSWRNHPDIHLFLPIPSSLAINEHARAREMKERLNLLEEDPYEIVNFAQRPSLDDGDFSKNLQAFYPIKYFSDHIRKTSFHKPNEGDYTVVILIGVETMGNEAANAFLKLLEEPPPNLVFLLTTTGREKLLPTLLSRCQQIRFNPLSDQEITDALIRYDGRDPAQAEWLARVASGNYTMARNFDPEALEQGRRELISFLRRAYIQDASNLIPVIRQWHNKLNTENQIGLCNTLELLLRDLMIYRQTEDPSLITNIDQLEVIRKFCESLQDARLDDMIRSLAEARQLIGRNVQFKIVFTTLAFRFFNLMRGIDPVIPDFEEWKHLPAQTDIL
ncbi:MAG: RuvB-like domain-containing protein [Balneolaceae bacterium]